MKYFQRTRTRVKQLVAGLILSGVLVLGMAQPLAATTYTVQRGDSLWSISRSYDITYQALAQANGIRTSDPIYAGQRLTIPGTPSTAPPTSQTSTTYTVVRGDSWWSIARAFNVNMTTLAQTNGMSTTQHIYAGQVLKIPGTSSTPAPTPTPTPPSTQATHTVARNESWWSIARTYGISMVDLAAANNTTTSSIIHTGQVLKLPGTTQTAPTPTPAPTTRTHTVVRGDTWWSISRKYGISMTELIRLNGASTTTTLYADQVLKLPGTPPASGSQPDPGTSVTPSNQMNVTSIATVTDSRMANQAGVYKLIMQPNTLDGTIHVAGGGLGIMIQTPNGRTIMVDGGFQRMEPGTTTLRMGAGNGELSNVKTWLATHAANHVDAWIITHPHDDHARVPAAIIHEGQVRIDRVYGVQYPKHLHDQKVTDESSLQSAFVYDAYAKAQRHGIYTEIAPGRSFELDGVRVEFLNGQNLDLYRENDSSAVMRITFAGSDRAVLLLADIQADGAKRLIARYPSKLSADVVQMAHHGLDTLPDLYRRIGASVALLPAGRSMSTRWETQAAIANLKSVAGSDVYDAVSYWQMVQFFK